MLQTDLRQRAEAHARKLSKGVTVSAEDLFRGLSVAVDEQLEAMGREILKLRSQLHQLATKGADE